MPHSEVINYAVCPKCNRIYKLTELTEANNGREYLVERSCEHIETQKCNTPLMKRIKVSGSFKIVPRKYRSLIYSLKELVGRKDFLKKCENEHRMFKMVSMLIYVIGSCGSHYVAVESI